MIAMYEDISMKFKKIINIREAMIHQMDNCQELKKLCKYNTDTPLAKYGFLKDNTKIEQVDVTESIIETNIIPSLFDESLLDKERVKIFVYPYKGDFSEDEIGDNFLGIDILCPNNINRLNKMGAERIFLIAGLIADMFDDKQIKRGDGKAITHCKAKLSQFEVSKTDRNLDYIGISMVINIKTSNLRTGRR